MWFKKVNNLLMRTYSNSGRTYGALQFGIDAADKPIVIGTEVDLVLDHVFTPGSGSLYGKGSIVLKTNGSIGIVDADGLWQAPTITTASQSASPSASPSPSSSPSASVSLSPSLSLSPSASVSRSPSASPSPSS